MSLFLKNTTESELIVTGRSVGAGSYEIFNTVELTQIACSDSAMALVGDGSLIAALSNDGASDLPLSETIKKILGEETKLVKAAEPFPDASLYYFRGLGSSGSVSTASPNLDVQIAVPRYTNGCEIILEDTTAYGISVDFQVVDVDNIFGYGAEFLIEQFGWAWQLSPKQKTTAFPGYLAFIPAGLYVRCKFNNLPTGTTNVYVNLYLHEKVV